MTRPIKLNFIPFSKQNFKVSVFRRLASPEIFDDNYAYYRLQDTSGEYKQYEVSFSPIESFEEYELQTKIHHEIIAQRLYNKLWEASRTLSECFIKKQNDKRNKRLHFKLEVHPKGQKCIWIEPYYLKSEQKWGILLGFQFVVSEDLKTEHFTLDRDILIASGALNSKGQSNLDFYLFKHNYIQKFMQQFLPKLDALFGLGFRQELFSIKSFSLSPKEYFFKDNYTGGSAYLGLSKAGPLDGISQEQNFKFIYLEKDREYAVALLKGLRGDTHPSTFGGMEKLFRIKFSNNLIAGTPIKDFDQIDKEIEEIRNSGLSILPIIITDARKTSGDDKLYFILKNKFTNAGIPCQVVTKDLIQNENALRFSLSNIGLQIFAKSGGKPWKMKPAGNDYLIIGIGQSYNIEHSAQGNLIEKNITYSVLTDSSGIFKDIQVLSEGLESEATYWNKLVENISRLILQSGMKRIAIHAPFRMSKPKILELVSQKIGADVELSVLVINDKNDYFGFDYANNGLVPFESTFIKLSKFDYLVWFEGIQSSNPKITKRFGNPLLVKFWYSNKPELLDDYSYRESLLQDCINLSGANWRGFKAKQLPVSIFYCQRIAEFIGKFREYNLAHVEINNLKPWFL